MTPADVDLESDDREEDDDELEGRYPSRGSREEGWETVREGSDPVRDQGDDPVPEQGEDQVREEGCEDRVEWDGRDVSAVVADGGVGHRAAEGGEESMRNMLLT